MMQQTIGRVVIRRAVGTDLPAISAIERASFSDPWTLESLASAMALAHVNFLVAEEGAGVGAGGASVVGYVVALHVAGEGEIADLAVGATARRRGVGRSLLDRVVAEARQAGIRTLYLEVRESNSAALALYQQSGFREAGRRRGYYRHPVEDALVLRRNLDPT